MDMTTRRNLVPRLLALALVAMFFGLVPVAAGHVDTPTVTAQHAFIGDPLFGLDTTQGTLFATLPDERTAMASTTKLMTLDVLLHAVADGVVSMNDQVTVDAFAASIEVPSSLMATIADPFCRLDANGVDLGQAWSLGSACVTLEPGEVVSLETLSRGMMYPSGNDAAWAIAYYVAQAYGDDTNGDSVIDGNDFVERMNQHAAALGFTDTHFTSANGWDDPITPPPLNHYTTARELSMTIHHGLQSHPHFGEVIGFQGTYTDTTQGPNGPKTYQWGWGSPYPGWEGAKGGGTTNCNGGPGGYCLSNAAKRIGRRVVASCMQCMGSTLSTTMFDFGFAQIFHPDPRGGSASVGVADADDTVCFSSSRCASAVLPESGDVKVVSWEPDVDGSSITVLDQETVPGSALPPKGGEGQGPTGDVTIARLLAGAIVVANRKGSSVELSRWSQDGSGALTLLDDGIKAGPALTMDLQPVSSDTVFSAFVDPDGALVLRSWRLDGSSLAELDVYRDESRVYSEAVAAAPLTTGLLVHQAVTAAVAPGVLVHDVWSVDPTTGEIGLLGELVQAGTQRGVEFSPFFVDTTFEGELFPPAYYATAFRASNGDLAMRFYRIAASGDPVQAGSVGTALATEEVGIAPLGIGGLLSAQRAADGGVELIAWELRRNANSTISDFAISQHTALDAGSLDLARVPGTHADGDYVTAVTDPVSGELRLRQYRSGDRPY
jgi:D-alanyl-D-alanine carboxypeptidase